MDTSTENRPISNLSGVLGNQIQQLMRTECQLARKEVSENLGKMRRVISLLVIGLALLLPTLTIFLQGLVIVLMHAGMRADLAAFVIGGAFAAVGFSGSFARRRNYLRPWSSARFLGSAGGTACHLLVHDVT